MKQRTATHHAQTTGYVSDITSASVTEDTGDIDVKYPYAIRLVKMVALASQVINADALRTTRAKCARNPNARRSVKMAGNV